MKRILIIIVAVFLTASVFAQSPEKMSYQAVIRNNSDALVTNQSVGMQISILRGSASGTAVYIETQTPTTNANGLVSIEIGTGIVVSGDFTTIDWANDTYFIKTETDPTGGTSYTITGTSQLLSVPYALHAKTAETVTTITETDPVYSGSQAANITATDITNLSNLSGVNRGDQDISGIATNQKAIQDTAKQIRVDIPTVKKYSVGDFAQGGIVFWVDETGEHGLVCAKKDQDGGSGIRWYAGTYTNTMAMGDGPYAGELNTAIIIANQGNGDGRTYAARICNELQITEGDKTYGDWYLPSKEELNLMYQSKATITATAGVNRGGGFVSAYYWSSTESNRTYAWVQFFDDGSQYDDGGKDDTYRVRAVRAF